MHLEPLKQKMGSKFNEVNLLCFLEERYQTCEFFFVMLLKISNEFATFFTTKLLNI